jgi:hypothetical protein
LVVPAHGWHGTGKPVCAHTTQTLLLQQKEYWNMSDENTEAMPAQPGDADTDPQAASGENGDFRIEGQVQLDTAEATHTEMPLRAVAFGKGGQLLGSADVDNKGSFSIPVDLLRPVDVDLYIGPAGDQQPVRESSAYSQSFFAQDWVGEGRVFRLRPNILIPRPIWWPWRPTRICVGGRIRKVHTEHGHTESCPVPYVKVEIFDVDREGCWWPYILRWWDKLIDRPVIRVPDLLKERVVFPRPFPPDPIGPVARFAGLVNPGVIAGFNPQPDLPGVIRGFDPQPDPPGIMRTLDEVMLNPQPLPPRADMAQAEHSMAATETLSGRVGEMQTLAAQLATRVENLTLTSKIAPWSIFPFCFYSRQLICQTYTDCQGYFRCCFYWWPLHFRRGRLRFDSRPDIIIRVTQIINGVPTVIYMDPYTSTRWNVTNAYIDLTLDNEEVQCGSDRCPDPPPSGPEVFLTRIGEDEIYKIDQSNGLYPNAASPDVDLSISNLAYGGDLVVHADFGAALSSGAPQRYYRLSYAKKTNPAVTPPDAAFQPITSPSTGLSDTRVNKITFASDTYFLGPQTVGVQPGLYEIRDTVHYHWYNQDKIAEWWSWVDEPGTGAYVLRLEVFDELGNKLTTASGLVNYLDGTHVPTSPATPLPPMIDHCDMVITLDNKGVDVVLHTPATNDCGLIEWTPGLTLNFDVNVHQGHGRLHAWGLYYTKGTDPTPHGLGGGTSNSGAPDPVIQTITVPSNDPMQPMIYNLTGTCAYALKLWGYAHVTDGTHNYLGQHNYLFYDETLQAIAIEKCPACPPPRPFLG